MSVLSFSRMAHTQDETPEALFRRGTIMFRQDRLIPARLDFNQVLTRHPDSEWAPAAAMMLAKTFYALNEYEQARSVAQTIMRNYPRSSYVNWAPYLIAACNFHEGNTDEAINSLARIAADDQDSSLGQHALAALKYTIIPVVGSERVYGALTDVGIPASILDETVPAAAIVPAPEQELPITISSSFQQNGELRIGLLAPLSGFNADLGEHLKAGVEAVFNRQSSVRGKQIELIIADTKSDPVTAILATKSLIQQGVIAIIGPVLSESNFGPAAIAEEHGIPFLAPTTTNPNFTNLGSHVFQINQNPEVQAQALAEFAYDIAGFQTFAVIASNDPWGETVAEVFTEQMTEAGAQAIYTGFFAAAMDNHNILMNIRDRAPESAALIDSVVVLNPGSPFPDTLFVRQDLTPRGERMLGPINSVDCIMISATSEEAVQIASQIMEYHINTIILGDSGWWSNESMLTGGNEYIDGAFVVAPPGELSGGRGAASLGNTMGSDPVSLIPFLRGADAAGMLFSSFESGALDPAELTRSLKEINNLTGYSSRISIDPERRMNRAVDFVRITNTHYERVDRSQPELLRMQLRQLYFDESPMTPDIMPVESPVQ